MNKWIKIALLVISVVMVMSCQYDFIAPDDAPPVDPGIEVSFDTQILPIFTDNNNCTACHKPGGKSPDLTAANAYAQINSSKYINLTAPDQSLIYKAIAPGGGFAGHKTVTSAQAALILVWIQQGAKNN